MNGVSEVEEVSLPVKALRHDVPVDSRHVEVLKSSIRERGLLAPVIVWSQGAQVIDGFHRLAALSDLGIEDVRARVVKCSEAEFKDDRIISACMHKGVSFARVTLWVQEMFATTPWAKKLRASQAFRIKSKVPGKLSKNHVKAALEAGLSRDEIHEVVTWIKEKSAIWGLSPEQVANMLELADLASPYLIPIVRDRRHSREEVLTRTMLTQIVKAIPDHSIQEAVAKKAMAEKLTEKETVRLVSAVAHVPEEQLPSLLTTSWVELQNVNREQVVRQPRSYEESQLLQQRFEIDFASNLMGQVADLLHSISAWETQAEHAELDESLAKLLAAIAEYQGVSMDIVGRLHKQIETLAASNSVLVEQNESLAAQVKRLERVIGIGRELHAAS